LLVLERNKCGSLGSVLLGGAVGWALHLSRSRVHYFFMRYLQHT